MIAEFPSPDPAPDAARLAVIAVGRLRGQPPLKPMPIPWSGGP
jgi:hypothetical protein